MEATYGQTMYELKRKEGKLCNWRPFGILLLTCAIFSNTLLPGLQSFCVYAAVSIFTIYALQVTHFVAWFSLGNNRSK